MGFRGQRVRGLAQEVCAWVCVLWAGKIMSEEWVQYPRSHPQAIKDKLVKALGFSLSLSSKKEITCLGFMNQKNFTMVGILFNLKHLQWCSVCDPATNIFHIQV
jgi:hypothetical protein